MRLATIALCACLVAACSNSSDPAGSTAGSSGGGVTAAAGDAGISANVGNGSGTPHAGASGAGGVAGAGSAGTSGGSGPGSRADALAAIDTACRTALEQCPQLDVENCKSSNSASVPAEMTPCFGKALAIYKCVAQLQAVSFQCIGTNMRPFPQFCMAENAAGQACNAAGASSK